MLHTTTRIMCKSNTSSDRILEKAHWSVRMRPHRVMVDHSVFPSYSWMKSYYAVTWSCTCIVKPSEVTGESFCRSYLLFTYRTLAWDTAVCCQHQWSNWLVKHGHHTWLCYITLFFHMIFICNYYVKHIITHSKFLTKPCSWTTYTLFNHIFSTLYYFTVILADRLNYSRV